MAVFRDESGRRGRAVRVASVLGAAAAVAALGVFLVSIFPAPWSSAAQQPEPAPAGRLPQGHPLEMKAREREYRREEARLRALLGQAQAAQKRRKPADATEPVLAGFAVNWDDQSLVSLQQHADQLTHAMPEWIRLGPDGTFLVEEDPRVVQAAARLELTPTVSNYADGEFQPSLLQPLLASDKARKDAAQRLAKLCEERGFAGVNLDFENLDTKQWHELAALVEAAYGELHQRGFLLSIDVPADGRGVPVERLAAATDFLVVMAYDEHASTDEPGPIASPSWVAASAAAYLKRAPADRIVVALGAYGYDWPL
ncbi:MAG TPA: glycosyl hydrolase family 18 protein, partial [Myxococcales bacterium]|nr:glycosyl hydrolase family 18 protein [Myxococcales bacterium]